MTNEEQLDIRRGLRVALGPAVVAFLGTIAIGIAVVGLTGAGRTQLPPPVAADAGGGEADGQAAGGVTVVGTEFAFAPDPLVVASGAEVTFVNEGGAFHNLEIEGVAGFLLEADPGAQDVAILEVAPGTYVMFCNVPGHRAGGMEGTLVVE